MGISKKLAINLLILIIFVVIGSIVYADVKEGKEFKEKLIDLQSEEDLNEIKDTCVDKEYLKPYCKVADISLRLQKEEEVEISECEEIEYNGAPYYLVFQKDKWKHFIQDARETCKERLSGGGTIIIWDE